MKFLSTSPKSAKPFYYIECCCLKRINCSLMTLERTDQEKVGRLQSKGGSATRYSRLKTTCHALIFISACFVNQSTPATYWCCLSDRFGIFTRDSMIAFISQTSLMFHFDCFLSDITAYIILTSIFSVKNNFGSLFKYYIKGLSV